MGNILKIDSRGWNNNVLNGLLLDAREYKYHIFDRHKTVCIGNKICTRRHILEISINTPFIICNISLRVEGWIRQLKMGCMERSGIFHIHSHTSSRESIVAYVRDFQVKNISVVSLKKMQYHKRLIYENWKCPQYITFLGICVR